MSHFRKALAPLRSAHQHAGSPQHLEYHAHMSTTYTDIFYIRSIYKYINIYKYISIMCSCRPRSLSLAQLWEARGESPSCAWATLQRAWRNSARGWGQEVELGCLSLPPIAQCSTFLPLYKKERRKRSSLPSVVAHTCNPSRSLGSQEHHCNCKFEVRWSLPRLHDDEQTNQGYTSRPCLKQNKK